MYLVLWFSVQYSIDLRMTVQVNEMKITIRYLVVNLTLFLAWILSDVNTIQVRGLPDYTIYLPLQSNTENDKITYHDIIHITYDIDVTGH